MPSEKLRGLYAITPDEPDTDKILNLVSSVLTGRPALLQYRNKTASLSVKKEQAHAIHTLCKAAGIPLVINDDIFLAEAVDAEGVHLGKDDGNIASAREKLGQEVLVGISCYNDLERARQAALEGADYIAFGAFFDSSTKPQATRASATLLSQAKETIKQPLVAIGGISLDRAPSLIAAGADMLAVITDIFLAPDPAGRAIAYHHLFFDREIQKNG